MSRWQRHKYGNRHSYTKTKCFIVNKHKYRCFVDIYIYIYNHNTEDRDNSTFDQWF